MTRDEITRMAREHLVKSEYTEFGWQECHRYEFDDDELIRFAAFVAAEEREACAMELERSKTHLDGVRLELAASTYFIASRVTEFLAARIRARGGE